LGDCFVDLIKNASFGEKIGDPDGDHLTEERRYFWGSGEVAFFGKDVLLSIVAEL
jgi:hypothetical protein